MHNIFVFFLNLKKGFKRLYTRGRIYFISIVWKEEYFFMLWPQGSAKLWTEAILISSDDDW